VTCLPTYVMNVHYFWTSVPRRATDQCAHDLLRLNNLLSCLLAHAYMLPRTSPAASRATALKSWSFPHDTAPLTARCPTPCSRAASKRAYVDNYFDTVGYDVVSDVAKGTVTMRLARMGDMATTPSLIKGCSATFKLVAGHTFDLAPPAGASCPSNAIPLVAKGRTFCTFCQAGQYKGSKGSCEQCPAGTYQNLIGSTRCKACQAGYICYAGSVQPSTCQPGSKAPKPGASDCLLCPANTFSTNPRAATCTPCPAHTISKPGSTVCGVPWDK
jgi:hypothetical protein